MIGTDSPVNGWIASMDSKISGIQKKLDGIIPGYQWLQILLYH